MDAFQVMLGMTLLRVILPVGALLAIGEWVNRHGHQRFSQR